MGSLNILLLICLLSVYSCSERRTLWNIGTLNDSSAEFELGPDGLRDYQPSSFGLGDRYFFVGCSKPSEDFPYLLAGAADRCGESLGNSYWAAHEINILFPLNGVKERCKDKTKFVINILEVSSVGSVLKVEINNLTDRMFVLKPGTDTALYESNSISQRQVIEFEFPTNILRNGNNRIKLWIPEGGWIIFDELHLETLSSIYLDVNIQGMQACQ